MKQPQRHSASSESSSSSDSSSSTERGGAASTDDVTLSCWLGRERGRGRSLMTAGAALGVLDSNCEALGWERGRSLIAGGPLARGHVAISPFSRGSNEKKILSQVASLRSC